MKIVFYNPHVSPIIAKTLYNNIFKIFSYGKYKYLLKNTPDNKIYVLVDSNGTSLLPSWLKLFLPPVLEVYLWSLINHFPLWKIKILTKPTDISKDDILILFSLVLESDNWDATFLKKIKCVKFCHLSHFIHHTSQLSEKTKQIQVDYFISETNLYKHSKYFKKNFPWYKKNVYVLPFTFQKRFFYNKKFLARKNKALAIGTVVDIEKVHQEKKFNDFYSHYKTNILQPIRYKILKNKENLRKTIDCKISELFEKELKTGSKNIMNRLTNAFFNATTASKRNYFSFDMTNLLNNYRFLVVGEEICDLPGISFIEGMSCGTCYIGVNHPMYTDLGFIPNHHYLSYNGKIKDLIHITNSFQKNGKKAKLIAEKGMYFVRNNFSEKIVATKFFEDLTQMTINEKINKKRQLFNSFTQKFV